MKMSEDLRGWVEVVDPAALEAAGVPLVEGKHSVRVRISPPATVRVYIMQSAFCQTRSWFREAVQRSHRPAIWISSRDSLRGHRPASGQEVACALSAVWVDCDRVGFESTV